jgi:HD-like signal output (HDOD) protein
LADQTGVPMLTSSPFSLGPTIDEVVRDLEHLPSAPRVLPRLKQLLSDGNSAISDVLEMIRLDPGIAARVLQIGNSAYFGRGLRCYTVEDAIQRVGYHQVYELVATAVASQVLERPLKVYSLEADMLWQQSVACALAAEEMAEQLLFDRSVAYTIGLLHNIGMVAIDDWALRRRPELRFSSVGLPLETCEQERSALGFHQAEAGAALLKIWSFPPVMSEPVRWQYLPSGTTAHFQFAALLNVSKWIRSMVLSSENPPPLPQFSVLKRLNIELAQLEKSIEQVASRLRLINQRLEVSAKPGSMLAQKS